MKRLLLLSNSTSHVYGYLEHALSDIHDFFGTTIKNIAFVPFAGVTINYNEYTAKVSEVFNKLGYHMQSLHMVNDPAVLIEACDAIAVGGGNTFMLLKKMQETGIMALIRDRVINGLPYIGWSAGSNLACPTIKTTNDMPIAEPESFNALNLVPFQINPHYLDTHPDGFHGETREQRILEFLEANCESTVIGLREGSILRLEGDSLEMSGTKTARIFKYGTTPIEMNNNDDFSKFLK